MKSPARSALFFSILVIVILVACAPAAATPAAYNEAQSATLYPAGAPQVDVQSEVAAAPASVAADFAVPLAKGGAGEPALATAVPIATGATLPDVTAPQTGRMIIKNAELKLQVDDTDTSIDRVTQVVGDLGGYIISSRVWYQDASDKSYKYATISIGVPVDQFETAMRRLRGLALKVLDENASGQDVSNQYVDLQSQLANLQATRDRIRGFLQQAKTVDEALQVNQQLTDVEGQIEQVQGQMNYLSGRSAFSTITVDLEPKLADITPTPTPSPTPTATPTAWNPGSTFQSAGSTLVDVYQGIVVMLIWLFVAVVPVIAPPVLIVWLIWKLVTRQGRKPTGSA